MYGTVTLGYIIGVLSYKLLYFCFHHYSIFVLQK